MPTIIEMVNHTRLDCCSAPPPGCGPGSRKAIHHTAHRSAFGKLLVDQPLMRNVLADLAIESEAATIGGDAARPRLRRVDRGRRGRDPVQADRQRRCSSTGSASARRAARRRGARVPRRQRLRRGVGDAAPVSRVAAELDLGGLGQRAVPRRAAGDGPRPGGARGVLRRGRRGRRRRRPPRRGRRGAARRARRPRGDRVARPARRRADGAGAPGLAAGPLRRPGGRRRLLRLAARRRLGPRLRHAAGRRPTSGASSSATRC